MEKLLLLLTLSCSLSYADTWSYQHPEDWGKKFSMCENGKNQSPINIDLQKNQVESLPAIHTTLNPSAAELVNDGHTVKIFLINGDGVKNGVTIANHRYQLEQIHFHTPSETAINGKVFDGEAHFVFKDAQNQHAVIAVLLKAGKENTQLKDIFNHLPTKKNETIPLKNLFNPQSLLPDNLAYYTFSGSLTTPPCSELLKWNVLKTPLELSEKQIQSLQKILGNNARPLQPLNGRVVQASN